MELVSIILPYYRKKKFISKTIHSIINQTYKNFELLIIYDDTDKSDLSFIKKIKKNDKRIKLIINKNNMGAGHSRNIGIKKAKGKFIAFIDSDDIWKKEKIMTQLKVMKEKKCNISHTSYLIMNEKSQVIGKRIAKDLDWFDLQYSCDIGLSTSMIRTQILNKIKFPSIKTKEDYVLWLRLTKKGNKIVSIKKPLVYWRKLKNSLSSSTTTKLINGYKVYRIYLKQSVIKSIFSLFNLSINYLRKI